MCNPKMEYMKGTLFMVALAIAFCKDVQSLNYLHFDDCKESDNEGNIYIHKNATWLECKSGNLDRYCIAERKAGRLDCVPHKPVKDRIDSYASGWLTSLLAIPFYAEDTERKFANCSKIQDEKIETLQGAKTKKDCLEGRQQEDTVAAKNIYCTMTDNKVYYIDDFDWYKCKSGAFHLQRCVQQIDETYYCLSTQKIVRALVSSNMLATFNRRSGTFCEEFFENSESYISNYRNEMEVCSDFDEDEAAPAPYVPPPFSSEVIHVPPPPPPPKVTEAPYVPPPPPPPPKVPKAPYVPPPPPKVIQAPYVPPPPVETKAPDVPKPKPVARGRQFTTQAPATRRPRILRRPKITTYCKIKWGYHYNKCFDPKEAAEQMISRPVGDVFNRPDKMLGWGQMKLGDFFKVVEAGKQAVLKNDQSGMSIVEAVGKASGVHKCDVITEKLPINDAIYNDIAKPCICNKYRKCY